jgi:hypothetical protein
MCAAAGGAGRAQIQSAQAVPEGRGAISGVVVDAGSGKPITGAIVALSMMLVVQNGPTVGGENRQVTDSAGRFVFTKLPAADFTISTSAFGYFDGGYGRASQRSGNRRIALTDGQWLQNATVRMWRQISITGTVADETGDPVVGTWVRTLAEILISGQSQWVSGPVTRTDDRGMYRFAGLTPGRWIVMVPSVQGAVPADVSAFTLSGLTPEGAAAMEAAGRPVIIRNDPALPLDEKYRLVLGMSATPPAAAGGRPQVYPITFSPSARSLAEASPIDTSYGDDRTGVDVVLHPAPAFKVSGIVEGSAEAVGGLVLRLMASGSESLGQGNEAATTLVGANGAFTFLNVASGVYTLVASRATAGYTYNPSSLLMRGNMPAPPGLAGGGIAMSAVFSAPLGTMFDARTLRGSLIFTGRARVEVGNSDVAGVAVRLTQGATISGRVVIETTPGKPASNGLPYLSIAAEPAGGDPALGQPRFNVDRSNPSDLFTLEGLQPGEYLLRTIGGGLIKSIAQDGRDYTYKPFDASNGRDISGVVVTLTDQVARLEGVVHDGQDRPVTSNAAAICFPAERDQWSRYGIQPMRLRSTAVASNGAYRFASLPAGDYFIVAVDDAYADAWKDPKFLEKVSGAATRVTIGWGETKTQNVSLMPVR